MVERLTPARKTTFLVEHRQGHVVKMEGGQAKNQPVSFVNGERGLPYFGRSKFIHFHAK